MVKIYRAAQQWNQWLSQALGRHVLEAEKNFLIKSLAAYYGKHAVLVGVPEQNELLKASVTAHQVMLTPLTDKTRNIKTIEGDFDELPLASGSVDLVMLPHSLEYTDNPRQLLAEACRIVKPEGHIIIAGFNPLSFWGLKKTLTRNKKSPWNNNFIQSATVKKWLNLADFELVKHDFIWHKPPSCGPSLFLKLFDGIGRVFLRPTGGIYILIAKAKITSLTPIRLRLQQTFSNIRVSIPKPSMRRF
ncbi:MAG TPA: methyltransferase domain-containing protein [Gammaproteobacteria bacterium]|nr:methyltransferase domain-containing protein [Gammaproteobacteria bacterium]